MPKRKQRTTHWVPDDAPSAVCPFVLTDMHREGRIVAAVGVPSEWAVGTCLFSHLPVVRHTVAWLTAQLRDGVFDPMLIPVGEQVWMVDPCLYLSAGLLLWAHCPAPVSVIVALAESGMLGRVTPHPDLPHADMLPADETTHAAVHGMLSRWDAVRACMPRISPHADTQETVAELLRLIRTTAEFCGCEVTSISVAESLALCAYGAEYDIPVLCAMMLLLSTAFSRLGVAALAVTLYDGGEGVAIAVTASVPRGEDPAAAPEIAFCRALTEKRRQIFDAETRGGEFCLHMCTVRKDFALLGIKTEQELR